MWSQELLFCLGHCIVHCAKVMEELKMNRSEIFNFAVRRCLYFTWCNILFVNNSKVCVLPEISLHIHHAIGRVRKQKLPHSSNLMTRQPSLCPPQYFTILVTGILPFHGWKGRRKCWSTFYFIFKIWTVCWRYWDVNKNGTPELFPVWYMWAWTSRYKRRASEAVYIIQIW